MPKPPTEDWCAIVQSIGTLPPRSECQNAAGYYSAGFFGPVDRPDEFSFDYYLEGLSLRGFSPTINNGPDAKRSYSATVDVTSNGGLDLTRLPTSIAKWFPNVKFDRVNTSSIDVTISLKNIKYKSFHQTLRALTDAIVEESQGSVACTRVSNFWRDLCKPNTMASVSITTAIPVIALKSHDHKSFDIRGKVTSILGAEYKTEKKADDEANLTSEKELSVAVLWERYSDSDECKGVVPKCKQAAPSPAAPECNGSTIRLPERRTYEITDKGFDGGGRYRSALLARPPDKEVNTLPFQNPDSRVVQGPTEIFVCSKDEAKDTGGCGWTCTGSAFDFQFTIPRSDSKGEGRAPLHITPR